MPGQFLIDITDPKFFIPENRDVIEYIRRYNPFAHSDVGHLLFELQKRIAGAKSYCPRPRDYAYVVLHTPENRIFALAYGMNGFAFRFAPRSLGEATRAGGIAAPKIGPDWLDIDPWDRPNKAVATALIDYWGGRAFADAVDGAWPDDPARSDDGQ